MSMAAFLGFLTNHMRVSFWA